ncbi:hypothetical protein [Curtobacterium ammoniigenes]|uniref:hypothetical protein n=1 Tax=Curtobacterium ammoniigenes TaxID=395387 RepID=UPI000A879D2E|nr:hypothetical protein [Curtobacterium ammoniigenes]
MDHDQHGIQDSNEAYAVYVAQATAEEIGAASADHSRERFREFQTYLSGTGLSIDDWSTGRFRAYKNNVDAQIPNFVRRLVNLHNGVKLEFELREKEERILGNKADMLIHVEGREDPYRVSVKNYIGSSGILRPQVSSGTFLSFACQFVFDRVGVGIYSDPRPGKIVFRGSDKQDRDEVLRHQGRKDLIEPLDVLENCQKWMREQLLSPECEHYNQDRVRETVARIAEPAMRATLEIFTLIDSGTKSTVRTKFLAKIGMDGKEEALFFDSQRLLDSITSPKYHQLRARLNAPTTSFDVIVHRQNVRFTFTDGDETLLRTDVPFTVNTNGAWYRPREKYSGTRRYNDKGHDVDLMWGQRRPYKSREIATSTNTYVDLSKTGIFS